MFSQFLIALWYKILLRVNMPSTVIAGIKYHASSKSLDIHFISGNIYRYKNVPAGLYARMKQAFSKGKFFNTYIKGSFEFEQLNPH